MECPNCGAENPDAEPYCRECASPLESTYRLPIERRTAITVAVSIALLIGVLLSVVVMASVPDFGHSTKIPAREEFRVHVIALAGDNISVSSESSDSIVFCLVKPDGETTFMGGVRSFSRTFSVHTSGEWTLVWTNPRDSSVKMSYDASSSSIDSIRDPLLREVAWLVAIVVTLIVIMIVVIVFVTRRPLYLGIH